MYNANVVFKKGNSAKYEDVQSIKVTTKPAGLVYQGDSLLDGSYPSAEDIVITYPQGVVVIAKNTFESLTISRV